MVKFIPKITNFGDLGAVSPDLGAVSPFLRVTAVKFGVRVRT